MRQRRADQRHACRLQRDQRMCGFAGKHLEAPDGFVGLVRCRLQHALEHVEPALHADVVEQVGVVLRLDHQAAVERAQVQEELEVLVLARDRVLQHLDAGEGLCAAGHVGVDVEGHAHQRQPARIALQRQLAEQRAVGQGLVVEGVEHRGAAFVHQRVEAHAGAGRQAQRQQVDAVADQAGHVVRELARCRDADHDVLVSGEPVQRGDEAAEQAGEQTHAGLGAGGAHRAHQALVEQAFGAARVEGARGRARAVQRQVEHRQRAAREAAQPVVDVRLHVGMGGIGGFLRGEVGERGRRLELQAHAGLLGVQVAQLLGNDRPRPAVAHDVVRRHHEFVLLLAEAVEHRAEERAVLEREGRADRVLVRGAQCMRAGIGIEAAQVFLQQMVVAGLAHQHAGAVRRDGGAQRLVTLQQQGHGAGQGLAVQRAVHAQHHRFVVGQGSLGAQRGAEPDFTLRFRRRNDALDGATAGGGLENGVHAAAFPLMR